MRKKILVFGSIAGVISIAWMLLLAIPGSEESFDNGYLLGYAGMLLAFSIIVVAVKNYRDKENGGFISFGKAFRIGLGITLIASTIYVVVWLIYYYSSGTDFMERYTDYVLEQIRASGASQAKIDEEITEMQKFGELYKNPLFNALMTYMEILPVGVLVSLIVALMMKRKQKPLII